MRTCLVTPFLLLLPILAAPAATQRDTKDTIRSIGARKSSSARRNSPARTTRTTRSRRVTPAGKSAPNRATARPAPKPALTANKRLSVGPRPIPQVWDLARDFSTTANPNGDWSFGSTNDLKGPLELFPETGRVSGEYRTNQVAGWCRSDGDVAPYVMKNVSSSAWSFDGLAPGGGTAVVEPGKVALHPRTPDRFAVVQWTARRKGVYLVEATFSRFEQVQGRNSNYFVLKNQDVLENGAGLLTGYGQTDSRATYRNPHLTLDIGDTLRFAVGFGTDGNSDADGNLLDVSVRSADNPSPP